MFSDEQLAVQLQQGEEVALETIVRRYHGPIHAYITRVGAEYHVAADVVQEVFIKVCRHIDSYKPELSFKPWIYTIASNTYKDYLKKAYVQHDVLGLEIHNDIAAACDTPETAFLERAEREMVLEALQRLGDIYRQVLVLRYYQDLKLEEIALILEIPLGTVKSRLSTAIQHLRKIFVKEGKGSAYRKQ